MSESEGPQVVTLASLGDGAALELWQNALGRVLENIEDPNTDQAPKRRITLEFTFTCDDERRVGDVDIRCTTKLPSVRGVRTLVFYGKHKGELVAVEQPRQVALFPEPSRAPVAFEAERR